MDQSNKICAACRKDIDSAATLCPYCRSDSNYQYLLDFPVSSFSKHRNPLLLATSGSITILLFIGIIGCFGFYGYYLGGIFVGAFAVGMGAIVFFSVIKVLWALKLYGSDVAKITCPGCSHTDEYRWAIDTANAGEQLTIECSGCKIKSRVAIQPATA